MSYFVHIPKELTIKNIKAILAWCIYDWGISAFPVIVTTFLFATYFTTKIAKNEIIGTHQWGNAMALSGLIIAVLSPASGAIADYHGHRKYWLALFTGLIIGGSTLLWFSYPSTILFTLTCVVVATIGFNLSMVFYNALLPNLVPKEYVGRISGWGWGLGYFGGLVALLVALYGFLHPEPTWLSHENFASIRICGPLVGLWTLLFAIPLFIWVPDYASSHLTLFKSIRFGLRDLWSTINMLIQQKTILTFLIAQMIYIDGLNTLFAFGGIYAAGTFNMSIQEILVFGILMNAFAGIGSILLAWVDDWVGAKFTILLSLLLLTVLGLSIVFVTHKIGFWILTCLLCLFVGPVQSSSRSLMAQLVPKEKATELFGFYVLSGKISTFVGPWLLGVLTLQFKSQRVGMASILVFFMIGAWVLHFVRPSRSDIIIDV